MARLRVLVVEDSLTVRRRIVEALSADPGIEVVGEAEDGKQAIELCRSLRPDVVTLDMILPVMTGLAATEFIMAYFPTPILIVSASTNRGELFKTYDALAAGAVDVLEKPRGDETDDEGWSAQLVARVKLVSRIKVITHPRARLEGASRGGLPAPGVPRSSSPNPCSVVGIGASTGGPGAVLAILRSLPKSFPIPILLVLHIGRPFDRALADWLDGQSPLRVSHPEDGDRLPSVGAGRVLMAPADHHLIVEGGRLRLSTAPERHFCRPSVDELFESLAREVGDRAAGCLLTGMGRDGASGLLSIRRAGGTTLAQDEATSVVFGMPREAILLGAAERVLPLDHIASALLALSGGGSR